MWVVYKNTQLSLSFPGSQNIFFANRIKFLGTIIKKTLLKTSYIYFDVFPINLDEYINTWEIIGKKLNHWFDSKIVIQYITKSSLVECSDISTNTEISIDINNY